MKYFSEKIYFLVVKTGKGRNRLARKVIDSPVVEDFKSKSDKSGSRICTDDPAVK